MIETSRDHALAHTSSPIVRRAYDTHKRYCVVIMVGAQQYERRCLSVYSRYIHKGKYDKTWPCLSIGVAREAQGLGLRQFLGYLVISCFERQCSKQNTVDHEGP